MPWANPEQRKAYDVARRASGEGREKHLARCAAYHKAHYAEMKERKKAYREAHKDRAKAYAATYRQAPTWKARITGYVRKYKQKKTLGEFWESAALVYEINKLIKGDNCEPQRR